MFREIEDIVDALKFAKSRNKTCTVLIGAGCSVSAGIPTAQGFVDIIKIDHNRAYQRAEEKTYPKCMKELAEEVRFGLIAESVDKAKINWAHIALAQLIKEGYIDRVLTTNFDSLIMRACSLVGVFPAIYDLAASQHYEAAKVPVPAIFHLHGQRTGFTLLHNEKETQENSRKIAPIFEDAGRGRIWLVVGYSGLNDPVFDDHLAQVKQFGNDLYWVGYKDSEPAEHLRSKLLLEDKGAYYIKGFDADSFFVTLAQKLDSFPPAFVKQPFSHLESLYDNLTPYTLPKTDTPIDAMKYARSFVHEAVEKIEPIQSDVLQAMSDLLGGQYDKVVEIHPKYMDGMHPEIRDVISWAYLMQGNDLADQAESGIFGTAPSADQLFTQAVEKYAAALQIKPDFHEACNNWGNALYAWAQTKSGEQADQLFTQAGEKYAGALQIKEDLHEAFYNWGIALSAWAQTKSGEQAIQLFTQAGEKYAGALQIKEDLHEAIYNWGITLSKLATKKSGVEADKLFNLAAEKYVATLQAKPNHHEALYNWATALSYWAKTKSEAEADELFNLADEKYAAALQIKPDYHEALNNWGIALSNWATTKTGSAADELFNHACEKYAAALQIKPDYYEALSNWASALSDWAKTKSELQADELFNLAGEKYAAALQIKPDYHEALNSWGTALSMWAQTKSGVAADELFNLAGEKYAAALQIKPDYHESLYNWGGALSEWAKMKNVAQADELLNLAGEKYAAALQVKPGFHKALNNWGSILVSQAMTKKGTEADELFNRAGKKYAAALRVKPDAHKVLNNWGTALSKWAQTKSGVAADELFNLAGEKYAAALQIGSDHLITLANWGGMLLAWFRVVSNEEKPKLLEQAKDLFIKAEAIKKGSASYNLACVSAISSLKEDCHHWLLQSKKFGTLPPKAHLQEDSDLDSVRSQPWFIELLAQFE